MWHFGSDASVEYSGERFEVSFGIGQEALIRAYSKQMKDHKTRIRLERQEYPNMYLLRMRSRKNFIVILPCNEFLR